MPKQLNKVLAILWITVPMLILTPVLAGDKLSIANAAVANILFEYDGDEFVTYTVADNGFVEMSFASNTPETLYSEIIGKLKANPDIKGVLAGKTGPGCKRF